VDELEHLVQPLALGCRNVVEVGDLPEDTFEGAVKDEAKRGIGSVEREDRLPNRGT
jgi:hypothetical protein